MVTILTNDNLLCVPAAKATGCEGAEGEGPHRPPAVHQVRHAHARPPTGSPVRCMEAAHIAPALHGTRCELCVCNYHYNTTAQVQLHRYQRFLDGVLESMEEFNEVADLMARHATLAATQEDLKQQQQLAADLAEQSRCCVAAKPPFKGLSKAGRLKFAGEQAASLLSRHSKNMTCWASRKCVVSNPFPLQCSRLVLVFAVGVTSDAAAGRSCRRRPRQRRPTCWR